MRISTCISVVVLCELASAHPGNGIIALSHNAVLTGDALHNGIWRFEAGGPATKLTGNTRFHCHWVTQGLDGRLYAETLSKRGDTWKNTVFRLDANGANPVEVASADEGKFGVFAIGRTGEIIHQTRSGITSYASGRDSAFRANGRVARGESELGEVRAYAWQGDVLYLADGPFVRKVGADGIVRVVARVEGTVSARLYAGADGGPTIWGLAMGAEGAVYAAVPSIGTVVRISQDGSQRVVAQSENNWAAIGVAVHSGTVFLLESRTQGNTNEGPRVRAIRSSGKIELLGAAV